MSTKNWKCLAVLCALTLSLAATPAEAALFKVDNNEFSVLPLDSTWNTIAAPGGPTAVADSTGSFAAGVTVTYSGFSDSGFSGVEGAYDGGTFDNAADDYFFRSTAGSATVTISGLLDSDTYTIQLAGSTNNTGTFDTDFTVNGSFGDGGSPTNGDDFDTRGDGFDSGTIMTYSGVAPSSGDIVITMTRLTATAYFDAFIFEAEASAIPEPSTLALAGIGLLGFAACGRRRKRRRA